MKKLIALLAVGFVVLCAVKSVAATIEANKRAAEEKALKDEEQPEEESAEETEEKEEN